MADHLADRIRAEQRLRTSLPDQPPPAPDHTGPLPDWLADPRAWRDPVTPDHWRIHLAERRHVLTQQLAATGRRLAAAPPYWLRQLGTPPPPESAHLRRAWEHAAALAAAWRAVHRTPAAFDHLGARPRTPDQAAAFDALTAHLADVAHRTRDHHLAIARAQDPFALRQDAAALLADLGYPRPALTPRDPGLTGLNAPRPQLSDTARHRRPDVDWRRLEAEAVARTALAAVTAGTADPVPPETWMDYVPAPDPDDSDQQDLYTALVTALAHWRARRQVTGEEPLGPEPEDLGAATEWQHLTQALELYQQSRIQDRLALIRARRSGDRARLDDVTRETAERTNRRPRPAGRPGAGRPRPPGGEGRIV
jgi:hypothetical protein